VSRRYDPDLGGTRRVLRGDLTHRPPGLTPDQPARPRLRVLWLLAAAGLAALAAVELALRAGWLQ
jgi:hypothetical protein